MKTKEEPDRLIGMPLDNALDQHYNSNLTSEELRKVLMDILYECYLRGIIYNVSQKVW